MTVENLPPIVIPTEQPKQGSRLKSLAKGWFYFTSVIGNCGCLVVLFLFVGLVIFARSTGDAIREVAALGDFSSNTYEVVTDVPDTDKRIAIVPVSGVIDEVEVQDIWNSDGIANPQAINRYLDEALKDENVAAVILEVDSPGGTVYASDLIFEKVSEVASEKPLVVYMKSIAASGGYYVSLPAKHIVAHPESYTGSIGTIMRLYNLSGLADKVGVESVVIKSGASKDLLNELEPVKEEDLAIIQTLIDGSQERFVRRVDAFRTIPDALRETTLDGRILGAEQALAAGLIDQIGSLDDAVATASDLAGEWELDVIRYQYQTLWSSFFSGVSSNLNPVATLLDGNAAASMQNKPLYLWHGGI